MKKILFMFFCLFQVMGLYGQNLLKGNVKNKISGEAIAGVTLYLPDLKTGTTTDQNGNYILDHLPKGKFLAEFKMKDYNTISQYIQVNGETTLNIEMEEEVVEIHEVTITGTSQSTARKENPVAITTIGNQDLFQNTSTNLIDNISSKPGINQITTGAAVSKPVIRGLGYNRIVTLNNGIKQEGQQWGDEHGIEIDEYSIDRVEIIKGPGSLMYGSDAIAGVVNFLSPNPLPLGQIRSTVLANYQTNNHLQGYSVSNAGNIKGFNWLLRGSLKQAGNYQNKYDGTVYNSGFKENDLNGYLGVNKSWGYSHLHFSAFEQTIAMTEGERDSLGNFIAVRKINDTLAEEKTVTADELEGYKYDLPRQNIKHYRVTNSTKLFFEKSNLSLNLGYQQNHRREFGDVLEPGAEELYFKLSTINYDVRYQFPELDNWHFSIGANGMQQTNSNKGEEVIIPDYTLFDAGIYLFTQKKINEKISFAGGIRFDNRHVTTTALYLDTLDELVTEPTDFTTTKFRSINSNYRAFTGSIGMTVSFTENFSAKINLARGFRAPNMSEIGSNGRHEGTLRYELGDENLKAETSLQGDLGLLLNTEHVSTELSVFYNDIQNYIFAHKLESTLGGDSIADPADPAPVFKYTQGHAYLYGGEYNIDIHPHPLDWLHIENAISVVTGIQSNQPDSMKYLPFIPAARYQGELRCEFNKTGKFIRNFYLSASVNHYFKQDKIYSAFETETATPAYTLLDAGLGATLVNKKGNTLFSLVISATNLMDIAYQHHLSRLKYAAENPLTGRTGVFNMGRNFSFKILIPIDFKK